MCGVYPPLPVSIAAVTVFILSKDTFNIYVIQMMKSISDLQDGGASAKEKRRPAKVSSSVGSSSSSKPKKKIKINVEVKKENNKNKSTPAKKAKKGNYYFNSVTVLTRCQGTKTTFILYGLCVCFFRRREYVNSMPSPSLSINRD